MYRMIVKLRILVLELHWPSHSCKDRGLAGLGEHLGMWAFLAGRPTLKESRNLVYTVQVIKMM